MQNNYATLLPEIVRLAFSAGRAIAQIYLHEEFAVTSKLDESPLTQADIAAHKIIVAGLAQITPDIPILSEEGNLPPFEERQQWSQFWLVDPLDGTKEFIAHSDEFTVNIALIVGHEPIMGVIVSPTRQTCYYACRGLGAFLQDSSGAVQPLSTRQWPKAQPLVVAVSRRHRHERLAKIMADIGDYSVLSMGSSLKFCAIAEQRADVYPRYGQTCEWDTAAGQCILTEAGGAVVDFQGVALAYNSKEDVYNPGFIATGDLASLLKHIDQIKENL
jgi:3'(2'), 5'-bisphosphate nucleotidase